MTFQGLWMDADSAGRGVADPRILKGSIWPLDDDITPKVIVAHLKELEHEHIVLYEVDGAPYYFVKNWEKHQSAAYRTGEPVHPGPPDMEVCTTSVAPCTTNLALIELKGREENAQSPNGDAESDPSPFAAFWLQYPRKVDRAKAEKAWKRVSASDRTKAIEALPAHCAFWKREHPDTDKFIPHPTTWLTGKRWTDELKPDGNAPKPRRDGLIVTGSV